MIPGEIATMVAQGESETLEFKRSTAELETATRTICGMLNRRGGAVLIGVREDGTVIGQDVSDRTVEKVSEELNRIDPPNYPTIDRVALGDGKTVLMIRANRGMMRPYGHKGIAYIRVGNTTRRMTQEEYSQTLLERMHSEQRWENQPAVGWSIDDLDQDELRRTIAEAVRTGRLNDPGTTEPGELLLGMGLVKDGALLRAAVALFGNNQRIETAPDWTQSLLRVARFRGVNRNEFLDNRQFRGNVFTLLALAERFLLDNLPIAGRFTPDSFVRVDEPLYPPLALREALANAFCHRDYTSGGGSVGVGIYDDRLEVTSTGPLHFGLTPEMLSKSHESQPWNPLIADVFYRRGIIERWGLGTIKMAELTTTVGLPAPEIEDDGNSVTVRFRPSQYVPPQRVAHDLTERQRSILLVLDGAPNGLAFREIRDRLNNAYTDQQVRYDLTILRAVGLVISRGHGRGAKWERLRDN